MEYIKLAIKPHECTGNELCAVCGAGTEPQKPFDIFLDETSQLVCRHLAAKYAPELVSLMEYFYKGHYVEQEYIPKRRKYYEPTDIGYEKRIKEYLFAITKELKYKPKNSP